MAKRIGEGSLVCTKEKCAGAWDCPKRVKDINEYAGYNLTEEFFIFSSIGPMMIISFLNGILLFGLKGRIHIES